MENLDDQFSLKWNNFQSNLATGFHDLLQEEDMVDVTLAAEGKFLQAHKIILSVCSPYFKDLFKVNPCQHPIVILTDVGHQELADMLDFMYRGEASVRQEDLAAFLKLAETLKVKGLAGKPSGEETPTPAPPPRKMTALIPKKKKIVEATVFEPDDDPGDPDFSPGAGEPKRKRKRPSSPLSKTDNNTSASATNNSYVPITNPKEEVQDPDEVEFLDDAANDPLVQFITGKGAKQETETNDFDDSNLDMTGDDTHDGDLDMTAGPSNADDSTEQVPQGADDKGIKFMVQTPIWDFFRKTTTETGDLRAVCTVCDKSLRLHNTSVMVRHLRYLHPKAYDSYRQDYIQGRMGVGYDIRGGILGLPATAPKRTRPKKARTAKQKEVKKLFVLKAKSDREDSNTITESDLQQLVRKPVRIVNVSNKGTIQEELLDELQRPAEMKCEAEPESVVEGEGEGEGEGELVEVPAGYRMFHLPTQVVEYYKASGQVGEGVSELLQVWEPEDAECAESQVLVCRPAAEGGDAVEVIIAN